MTDPESSSIPPERSKQELYEALRQSLQMVTEPEKANPLIHKLLSAGETKDQIRSFADEIAAGPIPAEIEADLTRDRQPLEDYRQSIRLFVRMLLGEKPPSPPEQEVPILTEPWRVVEGAVLYWLTWMNSTLMTNPLSAMEIADEIKGTPFEISPRNIRLMLARLDEIPGELVREYPKQDVRQRLEQLAKVLEETEAEMRRRTENN